MKVTPSVFVSQKIHLTSITETNQLMFFEGGNTVCPEDGMLCINTLCLHNVELLDVESKWYIGLELQLRHTLREKLEVSLCLSP
jgi:hypothetical protein